MSIISQWLEDPIGYLLSLLPMIPAILPALILHEAAHGYIAYRLGDPTAKLMGRLSLNPLKHLDLWGTICMFVIGLGWARPVPVDPRFFKHKRRDIFLVSIGRCVEIVKKELNRIIIRRTACTRRNIFCCAADIGARMVKLRRNFLRSHICQLHQLVIYCQL